ncbi:MAG TPA: SAF domain-containing protein, partial [Burkholderiales bacterium]|nr:SAF domain-containing protein [Burkholderiales bacterium]
VWGRLMPARDSLARSTLPIGLADGARVTRAIQKGAVVTWADVALAGSEAVRVRREMEGFFGEQMGLKLEIRNLKL